MKHVALHKYEISGWYIEGEVRKPFNYVIEAPDNLDAMQIACGRVLVNAEEPITLDCIHYEIL